VSLYNRFPDLCRAFAIANKTEKTQRLAPMRDAIETALTETPPPATRELAARLGCTEAVMKYRYPELNAALIKRLPERKRFLKEQLLIVIRKALIEDPPPSMETVAARVGKNAAYLRSLDPDLFKTIRSRHQAQRESDAASRRIAFRAEIACAVADLLQRGLTPSRLKVLAAIPHPSMKSSLILDQQIVATLREIEALPANIATGGKT
jgi:hypothetical protein